MDPKMDSGYLGPGETLEDNYDVSRNLSLEEVVGIMDQLLCLEVSLSMQSPRNLPRDASVTIVIDGLAYGQSALPNTIHVPLSGTITACRTENPGRCPISCSERSHSREPINTYDIESILYRFDQVLRLCS